MLGLHFMTKNTPVKFASCVLFELANIHALLEQVQAYEIAQMAKAQGKTRQEVSDVLIKVRERRHEQIYRALLKEAEMEDTD